jgi:hypothetical protein
MTAGDKLFQSLMGARNFLRRMVLCAVLTNEQLQPPHPTYLSRFHRPSSASALMAPDNDLLTHPPSVPIQPDERPPPLGNGFYCEGGQGRPRAHQHTPVTLPPMIVRIGPV